MTSLTDPCEMVDVVIGAALVLVVDGDGDVTDQACVPAFVSGQVVGDGVAVGCKDSSMVIHLQAGPGPTVTRTRSGVHGQHVLLAVARPAVLPLQSGRCDPRSALGCG